MKITEEDMKRYDESSVIFEYELREHLGIPADHPKWSKLYYLAWDYGHAYGYSEVVNIAEDLVDLIKDEE